MSSDYGSLTAQTVAGARCNLHAVLPNGQDAAGVPNPKVAGSGGFVGWSYPQPGTDIGTGNHTVSCTYNGLSGTAYATFGVGT